MATIISISILAVESCQGSVSLSACKSSALAADQIAGGVGSVSAEIRTDLVSELDSVVQCIVVVHHSVPVNQISGSSDQRLFNNLISFVSCWEGIANSELKEENNYLSDFHF